MSGDWVRACAINDIDDEDLLRFDNGAKLFVFITHRKFFTRLTVCVRMKMSTLNLEWS